MNFKGFSQQQVETMLGKKRLARIKTLRVDGSVVEIEIMPAGRHISAVFDLASFRLHYRQKPRETMSRAMKEFIDTQPATWEVYQPA